VTDWLHKVNFFRYARLALSANLFGNKGIFNIGGGNIGLASMVWKASLLNSKEV
jgi:hypothetical protein